MKARTKKRPLMSLERARRLIRDDNATYMEWCIAGLVLSFWSPGATYDDLLACLKRQIVRRWAAKALHRRTRRPRVEGEVIMNQSDWRRYLKAKGKL